MQREGVLGQLPFRKILSLSLPVSTLLQTRVPGGRKRVSRSKELAFKENSFSGNNKKDKEPLLLLSVLWHKALWHKVKPLLGGGRHLSPPPIHTRPASGLLGARPGPPQVHAELGPSLCASPGSSTQLCARSTQPPTCHTQCCAVHPAPGPAKETWHQLSLTGFGLFVWSQPLSCLGRNSVVKRE